MSEIEQVCDYIVMIRGGRLVHQGPVADLAAGQRPDIVLAPEHAADLGSLVQALAAAGFSVAASPDGGTVLVAAPSASAADLNRLAARAGITLRQIGERTRSLEDVYFQLTGTDAPLRAGQEMGTIR
jgi:ABC-2 type transport system ATP-binding protein